MGAMTVMDYLRDAEEREQGLLARIDKLEREAAAAAEAVKYDGHANRATWRILMWWGTDEGLNAAWSDVARSVEHPDDAPVAVADAVAEYIDKALDRAGIDGTLIADLIDISEVDWRSVASAMRNE